MDDNALRTLHSMQRDDWATPQDFFDKLNEEFRFDLDPCADDKNHKCDLYFTKEDNGLTQSWAGHRVFCNPPYCRKAEGWVKKCSEEGRNPNTLIVALLASRTDTRWFHDYIYKKPNVEIRFVKGRLKFGGSANSAPFGSLLAIWNGGAE